MSDPMPLCVDLDGSLIRSDLLVESALQFVRARPFRLFSLVLWLLRGRAYLKQQIATRVVVDVRALPYDERVVAWVREECAGRPVILCTAADQRLAAAVAEHVGAFHEVLASDGVRNLGGATKAALLCERFGRGGFDYAGNGWQDLPVWRVARGAVVINAPRTLLRRLRRERSVERVFERTEPAWRAWLAALRPHQWLKNALVFVPMLAAHVMWQPQAIRRSVVAFACFGMCASAAYLVNDLLDLDADRRHPRKRLRPFAAGRLNPAAGLIVAPALIAGGLLLSAALPSPFGWLLVAYVVSTLAYSMALKRIAMLDVVTLAVLYTLRIVSGAVAIPVAASSWLLAFSMFLFLSLAMLKRFIEVRALTGVGGLRVAGRGYVADDLPLLQTLGTSSGYLSVLVFAFYVDSTASEALYRHHRLLWLLVPVLFYWIGRAWLVARQGRMHDDPVVFALTDATSLAVLGVFAAVLALAA